VRGVSAIGSSFSNEHLALEEYVSLADVVVVANVARSDREDMAHLKGVVSIKGTWPADEMDVRVEAGRAGMPFGERALVCLQLGRGRERQLQVLGYDRLAVYHADLAPLVDGIAAGDLRKAIDEAIHILAGSADRHARNVAKRFIRIRTGRMVADPSDDAAGPDIEEDLGIFKAWWGGAREKEPADWLIESFPRWGFDQNFQYRILPTLRDGPSLRDFVGKLATRYRDQPEEEAARLYLWLVVGGVRKAGIASLDDLDKYLRAGKPAWYDPNRGSLRLGKPPAIYGKVRFEGKWRAPVYLGFSRGQEKFFVRAKVSCATGLFCHYTVPRAKLRPGEWDMVVLEKAPTIRPKQKPLPVALAPLPREGAPDYGASIRVEVGAKRPIEVDLQVKWHR